VKKAAGLLFAAGIALAVGFAAGHLSHAPSTRLLRSVLRATGLSKLDRELNALLLGRPVPSVPLHRGQEPGADLASIVPAPSLVVFSSVSCPHCRSLRAILNREQAAGHLGPLHVVLVGVDDKEEVETAADLQAGPDDWLRGSLPRGEQNLDIRSRYGLFMVPAIWFVDCEGRVLSRMNGFHERALERRIRRLLRKPCP
jgi:hypothetical protein